MSSDDLDLTTEIFLHDGWRASQAYRSIHYQTTHNDPAKVHFRCAYCHEYFGYCEPSAGGFMMDLPEHPDIVCFTRQQLRK